MKNKSGVMFILPQMWRGEQNSGLAGGRLWARLGARRGLTTPLALHPHTVFFYQETPSS